MKPTLVFDLDNTLCMCGTYYRKAHEAFVALAHRETGIAPELCLEVLTGLDLTATKMPNGWGTWRMPAAYAASMQALHRLAGKHCTVAVETDAAQIAEQVFNAPYTLYPGARETLHHYSEGGWQLLLVTKGDPELQERKIARHCLNDLFDGVHVVPRKSETILSSLLAAHDVDRSNSWSIGDSPKDDIGPALACGLRTIEIGDGGDRWAYENTDHFAHHRVNAVKDIVKHIPKSPTGRTAQAAA